MIATGSEVNLAIDAQKALAEEGVDVSVVSLPSFDLFEAQSSEYKESVLPKSVEKRISIEMGSRFGWDRYVGGQGTSLSIDTFGASAPGERVIREFGFTIEAIQDAFRNL